MDWARLWHELVFVLRRLAGRRRAEHDLDEEIRAHLELETRENVERGMSPEEARDAALRAFGNVTLTKEESRAMWGTRSLEMLWQDVRYGLRMIARNPGFTRLWCSHWRWASARTRRSSACSMPCCCKPLPVTQPEQLVVVGAQAPGQPGWRYSSFSYPVFRELREKNTAFSGMFARSGVADESERRRADGTRAGRSGLGQFLLSAGRQPAWLGRLFTEADDQTPGAHPVAVISFNFWQRRFGADPQIVGKTIESQLLIPSRSLASRRRAFTAWRLAIAPDVRIPLMMDGQVRPRPGPPIFEQRGSFVARCDGAAQTRHQH